MCQWSGWACDQAFDLDGDGKITLGDLNGTDLENDTFVDDADLQVYLGTNGISYDFGWI